MPTKQKPPVIHIRVPHRWIGQVFTRRENWGGDAPAQENPGNFMFCGLRPSELGDWDRWVLPDCGQEKATCEACIMAVFRMGDAAKYQPPKFEKSR